MATRAVQTVITYTAWDTLNQAPKTGDVGNHTLRWIKDGTASAPTNAAAEVDITNAPGEYKLTLTSTETDCVFGEIAGKSSTANVVILPKSLAFEYGVGNAGAGLTSLGDTRLAHLDADVSSRLATSSYTAPDNTTIAAIAGYVDTEVAAIKAKTDNLPASPAATSDIPTANANADALLDRAAGVETNRTFRQAMRLMLAAIAGKASGLDGSTATYRDTNDTKDRIVATVDEFGNRSAVTLDPS